MSETPLDFPALARTLDDEIVRLMLEKLIPFEPQYEELVSASPGLYAIFNRTGERCFHAGQSSNLRDRLFTQHYRGGGKGA